MQTHIMKTQVIILASILLLTLSLNSCKEEKLDGPSATITELGYNNSGIGYLGGTFNVVAEIVAEGKIEHVQIVVHQGSVQNKAGLQAVDAEVAWVYDTIYQEKYSGATSAAFEEFFNIPLTADTGVHIFQFKVTDMEGTQFLIEEEIRLNYGK